MCSKKCENVVTLTGTIESLSKKRTNESGVFFFMTLKTSVDIISSDGTLKTKEDLHEVLFEGAMADLLFPNLSPGATLNIVGKRVIKKKEGPEGETLFSTRIVADSFKVLPDGTEHINSILLTGEIVNTPKQGKSVKGDAYLFFNLATTSVFFKNKEKKTVHNIQLWGKSALANTKKVVAGEVCKVVGMLKTEIKNGKRGHPVYCSSIVTLGTKVESLTA